MATAIILSGCGVYDGSEIHESVLTLLALNRANQAYQCLAPNIPQTSVVDHLENAQMLGENRAVKQEAARIARGDILSLDEADPADYDSVILPGGSGAASNLCDFAQEGANCTVNPDVSNFLKAIAEANKPIGFICIAPVIANKALGPDITVTIGNDPATAEAIARMGGKHQDCAVDDVAIDTAHRVVSTPAYMLAKSISEVAQGVEKLVNAVLALR